MFNNFLRINEKRARTFENADSSRVIIDPPCSLQRCSDDRGRRDQIVRESIVEITLRFKVRGVTDICRSQAGQCFMPRKGMRQHT